MPISSQGKRRSVAAANSSQFNWKPIQTQASSSSVASSIENLGINHHHHHHHQINGQKQQQQQQQKTKSNSTFQSNTKSIQKKRSKTIKSISSPNSCATTSMALNNRLAEAALSPTTTATTTTIATDFHHNQQQQQQHQTILKAPTLSLAGQLILAGKQPTSLETKTSAAGDVVNSSCSLMSPSCDSKLGPASLSLMNNNHHYKFISSSTSSASNQNQNQNYHHQQNHNYNHSKGSDFYLSRSSLNLQNQQQLQQPSQASSTAQLTSSQSQLNHRRQNPLRARLNIGTRNMNLKYVKTLIIILMSLDLLMTIFLHQFATQDQLQIWLTTYKMRFSLLNLILSSIWFVILVGGIMFDVHFILLIACIVDVGSFVLLLILSIIHFYKQIDYNTVQLTSFLALLFSIIFLHVYLLVMSVLTIYLTAAVRRRKRSTISTG